MTIPAEPPFDRRGWLLCGAVGIGTLLRALGRFHWLLELTTHFAVQSAVLALLAAALLAYRRQWRAAGVTLLLSLANVVAFWPLYVPVASSAGDARQAPVLTFVTANVWTPNRDSATLKEWLEREQADVVFLCEPDHWWQTEVAEWKERWPHQWMATRSDNFGVGIFSRYPLIDPHVVYLDVVNPALLCAIDLQETRWTILGLHPLPPAGPRHSRDRNAQLQAAAQLISQLPSPLIVAGDLNMTSSSPVFSDFVEATGLRDTRQGRGLQTTWPAWNPLLRIPIDHCLVSPGVTVFDRRVGPKFGSDHLPVIVRLGEPAK